MTGGDVRAPDPPDSAVTLVPAQVGGRARPIAGTAAAPVRIAGLGAATPANHYGRDALIAALSRIWPALSPRLAALFEQMGGGERYLLRHPSELVEPLSPSEQTARYATSAVDLAEAAASRALNSAEIGGDSIDLLVVASCTGFVLPGVDVRLVPRLGLRADVVRMPFTEFGCAGGAAGLGRAADWVRDHPGCRALVVAVELPSLTFRPGDTSRDNLLSALVFGDGAGAAVLEASSRRDSAALSLGIGRVRSLVVPDSTEVLGYELADDGLRVILSRTLPAVLQRALPSIVDDFIDAVDPGMLAVHPGGRAILAAVQRSLGFGAASTSASWAALRRTGNTSSAGIFFVLAELAGRALSPEARGLALAFGPGLCVELLELVGC